MTRLRKFWFIFHLLVILTYGAIQARGADPYSEGIRIRDNTTSIVARQTSGILYYHGYNTDSERVYNLCSKYTLFSFYSQGRT